MKPIHVLVPLDGSAVAKVILPVVRGLAPGKVTLLCAIDDALGPAEETSGLAEAAKRELARLAEEVKGPEVGEVEALARVGPAADAILEAAETLKPSLIAMTTHGRTGFDRLVLGSVAETVIRSATVPVLAVRTPEPAGRPAGPLFHRVLVPYDGSDLAWRAVEALGRICEPARTPLTLLSVVESGPLPPPAPGGQDLARAYLALRRDGARADLEAAATRARGLGFANPEIDIATGWVAPSILERAEAGATLIAIATHGRSGISRWTLGSIAEKVLRAASIPLLICR
jgi:nucleotide-binding universal stress UspA family protein